MKTREQIITDMCYGWRHDFGLDKGQEDHSLSSGMTKYDREYLWRQMAQLFDNCIAPNMILKQNKGQPHSCEIRGCAVCDPIFGL